MIIGLELKEDHLEELKRRLEMLSKKQVKVGMFNTDAHVRAKTFTNVALFRYLADGDPDKNLPPRDVTALAFQFHPLSRNKELKKNLEKYFKDIDKNKTEKDVDKIMEDLGKYYRQAVWALFGNTSVIDPNSKWTVKQKERKGYKGQNPLIETGSLRSHIGYSYNNTVYEYGG